MKYGKHMSGKAHGSKVKKCCFGSNIKLGGKAPKANYPEYPKHGTTKRMSY
jgi:hypothetical protein